MEEYCYVLYMMPFRIKVDDKIKGVEDLQAIIEKYDFESQYRYFMFDCDEPISMDNYQSTVRKIVYKGVEYYDGYFYYVKSYVWVNADVTNPEDKKPTDRYAFAEWASNIDCFN